MPGTRHAPTPEIIRGVGFDIYIGNDCNSIREKGCLEEDNIDYDGNNDVQRLPNIPSKAQCMSRCQSNGNCEFWTWIKPTYNGIHGTGARRTCHLKSNNGGRKATQ